MVARAVAGPLEKNHFDLVRVAAVAKHPRGRLRDK